MMNEETKQALNDAIMASIEGLKTGAEFVSDQVPDVIMQLIIRDRVLLSLGVFVILAIWFTFYRSLRSCFKDGFFMDDLYGTPAPQLISSIVTGFLSLITIIVSFGGGAYGSVSIWHKFVTVWFAPKLYLIEFMADKLK